MDPGIDPAESESLFSLYFRSTSSKAAPGSGIGLFVCRELVAAMGGTAWARPGPDGGAEFGFALPLYVDADDALDLYETRRQRLTLLPEPRQSGPRNAYSRPCTPFARVWPRDAADRPTGPDGSGDPPQMDLKTLYATQIKVLWEWRGGPKALLKRLVITLVVATIAFARDRLAAAEHHHRPDARRASSS